jgi:Protein of unknown function (DUF2974)
MIEALRVGLRGSGSIAAPDVSTRLRDIGSRSTSVPTRENLIWSQAQPIVATAPQANAVPPASTPATRELAAMAADVYNDVATPPAGYRVATQSDLAQIGLKPQDLVSAQSSFRARVYVKGANESAQFVVAFRGSTSASDWQANFRQGVGLSSDHYQRALNIGMRLAMRPNENVMITGHSLGGGLASAAALAGGRDAATFNAAGLSDATIARANAIRTDAGIGRAVEVQAFYVRGEILSAIQDGGDRVIGAIFGGATGARIVDAPEAYGTRIPLTAARPQGTPWYGDNPVAKHGMDWVLSSLGRR